jgi:hypothetical protein
VEGLPADVEQITKLMRHMYRAPIGTAALLSVLFGGGVFKHRLSKLLC